MNDYTGQRFGKLTVICGTEKYIYKTSNLYRKYKCLCDCGKELEIFSSRLKKGLKSCGCLRIFSNLTDKLYPGLKINRWTVLEFCAEKMKWKLQCECGTIYYPESAKRILNGNTKSCGCLNLEKRREKAIKLINDRSDPNPTSVLARNIFKGRYNDGDLTFEQFYELSQQPCHYCGVINSNAMMKKPSKYSYLANLSNEELTFRYNGLDRISSKENGHFLKNCVSACYTCNHAKSDMSYNDFLNYIQRLINHKIELSFEEHRLQANADLSVFADKEKFSLFKSIRYMHKARYSDGDLTVHQFYQLSQLPCYYCGQEFSNLLNRAKQIKKSSLKAKMTGDFRYNGLDRLNPKIPLHNYDAVITCCKSCNFAKNKQTFEEFIGWIERLREFNKKR